MSYEGLYKAVKTKYAGCTGAFQQQTTNSLWKELKEKNPKKKDLIAQTDCKIRQLQQETVQRKAKATVYFCQQVFNCFHITFFSFPFYVKSITEKIEHVKTRKFLRQKIEFFIKLYIIFKKVAKL